MSFQINHLLAVGCILSGMLGGLIQPVGYRHDSVERCPQSWRREALLVKHTLFSADFLSPSEGWAVGYDGIFHWQDGEWTQQFAPKPTGLRLNDVKMLSENDGWVVGASGSIYHWDGAQWKKVYAPTDYNLYRLFFLSPKQGWAFGGDALYGNLDEEPKWGRVILEWNGTSWKVNHSLDRLGKPHGAAGAIVMISADAGFAVGDADLLQWKDHLWQEYHLDNQMDQAYSFQSIAPLAADDWWIAGYGYDQLHAKQPSGAIFRWEGAEWIKNSFMAKFPLFSIAMVDDSFGLAGGGDTEHVTHESVLVCWNGAEWKEIESPAQSPIRFIWAKSADDVWIFSGGGEEQLGAVYRSEKPALPTASPTSMITPSITPSTVPVITRQITITSVPTASSVAQPSQANFAFIGLGGVCIVIILGAILVKLKKR